LGNKDWLPFNYSKLETFIKTEVVILGGGISGALATYYLVKTGVKRAILDARTIGPRNSSLLQYEIDTSLAKLKNFVELNNAVCYQLCADAIETIKVISKS
jgi:2-polyprenyl-6-methoxyphenol hydroxylase-like FAD-dependent oxidoreductase